MSKHWKRFAAVVVSLTMAFQFCVNDFYAYAETGTSHTDSVEETNADQPQTTAEPEVTTEPVETPAQTEPAQEPAPEVETETTTPPEREQPQQPVQEQTPAQPEREVAGTLKLEFKDEEGNTLKTVDPIALTNKYVGDTIRLTDLGVDTNVADYTLVDIKDKNDGTKDYNPNSVDFTLTKNITELQLVYRANPKEPETTPTENNTNTTEDSQQGEGEEDSEADADEADTEEEDSEELKEEETEEPEEEVKKPEAYLSVTASDGATITVFAPAGALPEGSSVTVVTVDSNLVKTTVKEAVESEGKQLLNYKAYDITIYDADGNVIQPSKAINVSITNSGVVGEKSVYHLSDSATSIEKIPEMNMGSTQTFSTDHFSIYVVAGSEDIPEVEDVLTVTINFVYDSGIIADNPYVLTTEKDADGKYVVDYEIPEKSGYVPTVGQGTGFTIVDGNLQGTFETNDNQQVEIVYAPKDDTYTVKHLFENLNGEYIVDESKTEIVPGKVGELTEAQESPVDGFTVQTITQKTIEEGGKTVVEVKYDRNEYTLTYMTTGGSYIPSETLKYEEETNLPTGRLAPTRKGYTFEGWYTDEACKQEASDPYKMPAKDTRLYAKWDGDTVDYSVIFMTENANDDNYSYAGTVTLRAKAGTEVTADASTRTPQGFDKEHFYFETANSAIVNADGSTVITVKYARREYTITFEGTGGNVLVCDKEEHRHSWRNGCYELDCPYGGTGLVHWWHDENCYDMSHTICGKEEHTHGNECYEYRDNLSITAKYQADITEQWLNTVGTDTSWVWDGTAETRFQVTMLEDKTVHKGTLTGNNIQYMTYYVEDPEGEVTHNGKRFRKLASYTVHTKSTSYPTLDEEFFIIDGYDRYDSNLPGWSNSDINRGNLSDRSTWQENNNFYYTRSEYNLELVNGDHSDSYKVPYTADLHQYLDGTPSYNPTGDGSFAGWYLDPEFQERYEGDYKMPKGLVLYAKWNKKTYNVTFVDSENPDIVYDTQTIESGDLVDVVIPDDKAGYHFAGWYTDQDCETPFDYATQIKQETIVYAKWEPLSYATYTIKFETSDGTEVAKSITGTRKVGETILAKAATELYEGYEGYVPSEATHELVLKPGENEYTFIYSNVEDLQYKIRFVDENGNQLFETENRDANGNHIKVSPIAEDIKKVKELGYELGDQKSQWVDLIAGENVVKFECNKAKYSISYEELDGATFDEGKNNPTEYVAADLKDNPIHLNNPSKPGYNFTGWEFTSENGVVSGNQHDGLNVVVEEGSYGDLEFTTTWEAEDRKVTVNYIDDQEPANKLQASVEVATKYDANYDVSNKLQQTIDKEGKHYVLDSIDGNLTGGPVTDDVTVDLIYSLDEDKDGTPDKYEATVTFKVENGYFNGEEGTDSIGPVEYVLATKDETTNTWTPTEVTIGSEVEVPTPSPNTGYDTEGSWNTDPAPTNGTKVVAGDTTYTYTYGAEDRKVTVNYIDDQEPANKLQASVEVATKYDANYDVSNKLQQTIDKEGKHYVLDSIDGNLTGGPVTDDVTVDLIYSLDEDKDGTPDKYEATVTFKVENGYFNGEEGTDSIGPVEYVLATKDETTNTWTPTEVTIGSEVEVPTPSPNTGYDTEGSWNTDPAPTNGTKVVAGDTTYTYTYERDYATIKITPYTGVYDGQRHNVKEVNGIIAEDTVSYSLDGAQYYSEEEFVKEVAPVNVTNGDQGIFIKVVNNGTEHVYTSADGAFINISKLAITIKSDSASKVFDGTPLTNGNVEITDGELVDKSDVTYKAVGEITNVGKKSNTINVSYSSDQMKSNYDVTLIEGTLTVIPQSIDPEDPTDPDPENPDQPVYTGVDINEPSNVTYDGNAHQWKPIVTSGNTTLTEGEDYTVSYDKSDFTNVTGTITVTIEGKGNYRGTVTRRYQINPRAITLTSAGGTKTYDGTALTNGTVTITDGSLVDPSDLTYRATGTQTEVGSSLNYIDVEFSSAQMEANYTVTLQTGTLTVNAAPVTPVTPTPTPGGGDEGTGTDTTPTTGGPVAVADDDADAEDEPEEEEVEDEETPLSDGEEDVDEGKTPLAKIDVWALINLIAAIITVLFGLILLLSKRHKNDDEEDEEERQARIERGEEKEQEQKRGWICKVLGVLVAIGSVVLFILTEDMSLPMAMTDEWTIWMIIIAVVELVLLLVGRHWKDVDDDEEEQAQA